MRVLEIWICRSLESSVGDGSRTEMLERKTELRRNDLKTSYLGMIVLERNCEGPSDLEILVLVET